MNGVDFSSFKRKEIDILSLIRKIKYVFFIFRSNE